MNGWYWVKFTGKIDLYYLVSANSKTDARKKMSDYERFSEVSVATWGSLRTFLHARIPRNYKPTDPARGSIPFKIGKYHSYIHHFI